MHRFTASNTFTPRSHSQSMEIVKHYAKHMETMVKNFNIPVVKFVEKGGTISKWKSEPVVSTTPSFDIGLCALAALKPSQVQFQLLASARICYRSDPTSNQFRQQYLQAATKFRDADRNKHKEREYSQRLYDQAVNEIRNNDARNNNNNNWISWYCISRLYILTSNALCTFTFVFQIHPDYFSLQPVRGSY
jgi:hypothetical protein